MKTTKKLVLLFLITVFGNITTPELFAQRIGDVHGHTLRDAEYQRAPSLERLMLLSKWVGDRRTSEDAVRLLVRREATRFLSQPGAVRGSAMTPAQAAMAQQQLRGDDPNRTRGGAFGIGNRVPDQRQVTEGIQGRRDVSQVLRDASLQREFGGRLNSWYTLSNMAVRGGALQDIEIPGDLMDEMCMRMLFNDIRWSDPGSTPEIRLGLLEEIRRSRLWSPMLDHLAQAQIVQVLHKDSRGMSQSDRSAIAQLMILRTYKKKELLTWGPFHQQTEERLLLAYLDSPAVAAAGNPKAKLVHLRRLESEQMISSMSRTKFEIPYALEYLQRNQQFMTATPDGKRQFLRQLRDERMVDFLSISTLEQAFGVR